jgi:hypothetical protein
MLDVCIQWHLYRRTTGLYSRQHGLSQGWKPKSFQASHYSSLVLSSLWNLQDLDGSTRQRCFVYEIKRLLSFGIWIHRLEWWMNKQEVEWEQGNIECTYINLVIFYLYIHQVNGPERKLWLLGVQMSTSNRGFYYLMMYPYSVIMKSNHRRTDVWSQAEN